MRGNASNGGLTLRAQINHGCFDNGLCRSDHEDFGGGFIAKHYR
jgi:hypothetical protein